MLNHKLNIFSLLFLALLISLPANAQTLQDQLFNELQSTQGCTHEVNCALQPMAVSKKSLEQVSLNQTISLNLYEPEMAERGFAWIMWDAYAPDKGIAHFSQVINNPNAYLDYRNPLDYEDRIPNVNDWLFDAYLNRPDNPSALNKFAVFNRNRTVVLPIWDN